jgi:hypothetical protein
MPNLPDLRFGFKGKNDEKLAFSVSASVKNDGEFSVAIPEILLPLCKHLQPKFPQVQIYGHNRTADERMYSANLNEIKKLIAAAAEEYLKCDVTTERVIVYAHACHVAFWQTLDGNLCPSGVGQPNGSWSKVGDLSTNSRTLFYSVGIFARVYDRTVTTRGTMSKVTFEEPEEWKGNHQLPANWGKALNSFVHFDYKPTDDSKRIPYTEEAAQFFYQTLMALCGMADRLDAFLKDDKKVQQAIAAGSKNLLTS